MEIVSKRNWWLIVIIAVMVLGIVLAPYIFTRQSFCGIVLDQTGQIGDTIAGTTAPFVGLLSAFLLIYTLYKQLQFNKQQTKLSLDDQFKSSYFQMLDQQRKLAESVEYNGFSLKYADGDRQYEAQGYKAFKAYYSILVSLFAIFNSEKFVEGLSKEEYLQQCKQLDYSLEHKKCDERFYNQAFIKLKASLHLWSLSEKYWIDKKSYDFYHLPEMTDHRRIAFVYHMFFFQHSELGRYFRHIYYILTILEREETRQLWIYRDDTEQVEQIKKSFRTYAQFIPAQMTVEELALMYYNCALYPKTLDLAKRYDLFQTLPAHMLIDETHHYDPEINLVAKTKRLEDILGPELSAKLDDLRK